MPEPCPTCGGNPCPIEWYRIEGPYFTAGLRVTLNRVDFTAPILDYLKGWSLAALKDYCVRHRWKIERCPDPPSEKRLAHAGK
jgi:hypothetical protein